MMSWEEYREWFGRTNGGAVPSRQDYNTYVQNQNGQTPAPTGGGGPGEYGGGITRVPLGGGFGMDPRQPASGPIGGGGSNPFQSGPSNPLGGSGGSGGGGVIPDWLKGGWEWVRANADDLLKWGLIGVGVYNAIKGAQQQGKADDFAEQSARLQLEDYEGREPFRTAATDFLGGGFGPPRGLPSLGGSGSNIPSLAPQFNDPGNPYNRVGSLPGLNRAPLPSGAPAGGGAEPQPRGSVFRRAIQAVSGPGGSEPTPQQQPSGSVFRRALRTLEQ